MTKLTLYKTLPCPDAETLERARSRDVLADDQRVDVVGTLVRLYRFQIHHVAHDRIVVGDSVAAQDVAGHARALQRHPDIVTFDQRDVLVLDPARVLQPADV